MSYERTVLFWLVDYAVPDFISKFGKEAIEGRLLIASRQLWNLQSGASDDQVRSALIGPGYVAGTIRKGTGEIGFEERISAVIYDQNDPRQAEPIPLVDMISAEVIDPMAKSSKEEIEGFVRKAFVARGESLIPGRLAKVKSMTAVPLVQYASTSKKRIEIRLTSGAANAKFALGGVYRKMYAPLASNFQKKKYDDINDLEMFFVDKREMRKPTREALSEWMIVEQAAELTETGQTPADGYVQVIEEYGRTLEFMKTYSSSYVFL